MKVLHVVESFGGGVLTSVTQLCNILAREGFEVHLAYSLRLETPVNFQEAFDRKVTLHQLNMTRSINIKKDLYGLLSVMRLLTQLQPDVLHLHSSKAGFLGRLASVLYKLKGKRLQVFYAPRGFSFLQQDTGNLKRLLFRMIERMGYLLGGTIVACSNTESEIAKQKLKARRVTVIENAVDVSLVPQATHSNKQLRVGIVGRITAARSPQLFMKIAASFRDQGIDFVWVGGGEENDSNLLKSIPNIEVTGWLLRKDALIQMSSLDIYLHTSLWEGMPLAVIEAMLAGLPVVVTDVVGNRDIVKHRETGFIAQSEEQIIQYLQQLIESEELRLNVGDTARKEALHRFSLERLKQDIISLYKIKQ